MAIIFDISDLMWNVVFGFADDKENVLTWLIDNVGPETERPEFPINPIGLAPTIRYNGEEWAIVFETLYEMNPQTEEEWGKNLGTIGACQLPYSKRISRSKYYLHITDPKMAIMFKLRWL